MIFFTTIGLKRKIEKIMSYKSFKEYIIISISYSQKGKKYDNSKRIVFKMWHRTLF